MWWPAIGYYYVRTMSYNNNNNGFFCANILEDQAHEDANRLRETGSIKEMGFRRRRNEAILPSVFVSL